MTRGVVKQGAGEAAYNTSYPFFSGPREEFIYRWMLKTQPDALRDLVAVDPALFRRGLIELAKVDPELSRTIARMGDNPTEWLRLMDAQWGKMMRSSDPAAVVEGALQRDLVNMPEMAEIYGRIYDANQKLLGDLRAMMYGNPNRGQIERTLNSFLLYWPISYQIKASKWLVKILYGKIGGVQTGGLGALALDRMQADHEKRLAEDPEYVKFFEDNQALIFAAQMLVPMTPGSMGTSLSPVIRDLFFAGTKQVGSMGPVYTITKFVPSVAGDLYPYMKDMPFVDEAYRMATGWNPPKEAEGFVPLAP
jgi:hypothetical protein